MALVRRHYSFGGRVQGVGFRYTAQYIAQGLGLSGWVRNEWDDTVTMEVQGKDVKIDELIYRLNNSRSIRIDRMGLIEMPLQKEKGFHVR